MCAIDATTVKRSEAQFRSRWSGLAVPSTPSGPSTSTPFSSMGGVTLDAIMAQLHCKDTRLDTLFTKLYQVNTRVDRIARWQAHLGGFVESSSPPPKASEASEDDDDSDDNEDDEDGSSFGYESSHT